MFFRHDFSSKPQYLEAHYFRSFSSDRFVKISPVLLVVVGEVRTLWVYLPKSLASYNPDTVCLRSCVKNFVDLVGRSKLCAAFK